jgi:hypothetical protein
MSTLPPTQPQPQPGKRGVPPLQQIAVEVAPAAFGQALKSNRMIGRNVARLVHNGMSTAGMAPRFFEPGIWEELVQMQGAIFQRLEMQRRAWLEGCAILMQDYVQIRQANTMSKLVEKQYNLVTQWHQLLGDQATNLLGLQENIQVSYGYWISRKLGSES